MNIFQKFWNWQRKRAEYVKERDELITKFLSLSYEEQKQLMRGI